MNSYDFIRASRLRRERDLAGAIARKLAGVMSRVEQRAALTEAMRNTAILPVPALAHGKTRSEHGGGSV